VKIACVLGHKWNGCTCARCGAVRNAGHSFAPVPGSCTMKCARCGAEGPAQHRWSKNGRGCKCTVCGATRAIDDLNAHDFPYVFDPNDPGGTKVQGCKCQVCGYVKKSEFGGHVYKYSYERGSSRHKGVCVTCGKEITSEHFFENGVCRYCGYKPGVDLNKLVADFAVYVNLTLDESELDAMEQKLLAEGDAAEAAIFSFLTRCSFGGVGNIRWWSQAKRLTRMLPKFHSGKVKEHLKQLADNASRTNIWEYHTEIAGPAKEELAKL